ncbi:hypothetical protein A3A66_03665 [Microgenomates group bacterium RIFCSPLOWO2_01_FULL_46_13]|nr:MAG: hypothetical protein A2783_03745 [Microgenomates group bacterium RIFCSPHIGHO2_01_FULL_45_11]OGV95165.1 MAG: hypothetical protein A3A66_03665 [Microgenomates group bacterium RIFCSPLOWO2_01_FULL_46_13]
MAKILLIDDDPVLVKLYTTRLQTDKHEVKSCGNGDEGLKLLESFQPDLVVLDLMMPKVNGFMFIDALRGKPELRTIPILVFSSLANPESIDFKYKGITKVLNKVDVTPTQLVRTISEILASNKSVLSKPAHDSSRQT